MEGYDENKNNCSYICKALEISPKDFFDFDGEVEYHLSDDELKNANITDLKSLLTGSNSYASKMLSKGKSISLAAAGAGGTYTSNGHYSNALPPLVSGKIDTRK